MAEAKKERPTYTTEFINSDYDEAVYLDNAHTDNLMTAVLGIGAELWALRRRLMVLEKFAEEKHVVDRAAIEAYNPTDAEKAAWDAERDDFISRIFSALTRPTTRRVGGPHPSADRSPPMKP